MASSKRRAGLLELSVGGTRYDMMGEWKYNLGIPKRKSLVGPDGVHGYQEEPQPAFIEGKILDKGSLDLAAVMTLEGVTAVLKLASGPDGPAKAICLTDAWQSAEGDVSANNAEIDVRFESENQAEEIAP